MSPNTIKCIVVLAWPHWWMEWGWERWCRGGICWLEALWSPNALNITAGCWWTPWRGWWMKAWWTPNTLNIITSWRVTPRRRWSGGRCIPVLLSPDSVKFTLLLDVTHYFFILIYSNLANKFTIQYNQFIMFLLLSIVLRCSLYQVKLQTELRKLVNELVT